VVDAVMGEGCIFGLPFMPYGKDYVLVKSPVPRGCILLDVGYPPELRNLIVCSNNWKQIGKESDVGLLIVRRLQIPASTDENEDREGIPSVADVKSLS